MGYAKDRVLQLEVVTRKTIAVDDEVLFESIKAIFDFSKPLNPDNQTTSECVEAPYLFHPTYSLLLETFFYHTLHFLTWNAGITCRSGLCPTLKRY